jgi:hypothetical protein
MIRLPIPDDCCGKARELIAGGLDPAEVLEFMRGDVVCLRGTARAFASRCVVDRDRGTIRHERWTPIEGRNRRPQDRAT